ncbi:MAG: PAS domain S-box protein [Bacteroidota bacterium]
MKKNTPTKHKKAESVIAPSQGVGVEVGKSNETLRRKAEEQMKKKASKSLGPLSEVDALKLIHELEVHQIELELQNEELMLAKEQASADANKYTELYDFAPSGYFTLSNEGNILELNLCAATMLGKPRSQAINNNFGLFVTGDTLTVFNKFLEKVLKRKTRAACNIKLVTKDNATLNVHLTGTATDDGKTCHITAVDITELKKANEDLLQSEEKYRHLVENSDIGVATFSLDGTLQYLNHKASQNFGGGSDDFVGKNLHEIFGEENGDIYLNRIQAVAQSKKSLEYEDNVLLSTGNYWFLSNHSRNLDDQGKVTSVTVLAHDITERKNAEEQIAKANNEIKHIFELVPDILCVVNSQGYFINVNRAFSKIMGFSANELLKKTIFDLTHPDDLAATRLAVNKNLEGQPSINFTNRCICKNASFKTIEWNATPSYGGIIYATGRDITERRQAEEILHLNQKKLNTFIEATPRGVFLKDEKFRHIVANSTLCKLYGKTEAQVKGLTDYELMEKTYADDCRLSDIEALASKSPVMNEEIWGDEVFESIKFPVEYEKGKIGVGGYIKNITKRKLAEAKLSASEEKFRSMVETTADIIWETSIEGLYTYVSPQCEKLLGYKPDELIGTLPFKYMEAEEAKRVKKESDKIVATQKPFNGLTNTILHKDGRKFIFETSGAPFFDKENNLLGYRGIARNITERKQAEEAIRMSEFKLNTYFDNAADAIYVIDTREGKIVKCNNRACADLGYSKDELMQLSPADIEFKLDNSEIESILDKALFGSSGTFEGMHKRKDGTDFPVEIRISSLAPLQPNLVLSIVRDISARKHAEKSLMNSYKLLQNIIDLLPVKIFWKDLDLNYLGGNLAFAHTAGKPSIADVTGKNDFDMIWKEHAETYRKDDKNLLKTGKPKLNFIEETISADGVHQWVKTSKVPLTDLNGKTTGILGVYEDITERKKIEEVQLFLLSSGFNNKGEDFFTSLARYLSETLGMEYVCIDKLLGDNLTAQTVAIYNDGKFDDNVSYTLKDTPCGDVVGKTICCFPEKVCHLFPHDVALQDLNAESYVGTTLWSFDGKPIGLIAVIGRKPLNNPSLSETIIKLVGIRAAAEMERLMSEEALRKSEAQFSLIANHTHDMVWMMDLNLKTTYVSPSVEKVRGFTLQELAELPLEQNLAPGSLQYALGIFQAELPRLMTDPDYDFPETLQLEFYHKDGSTLWLETIFNVLRDENGKATSVIGEGRNITERRKAEQLVKDWNTKFSKLSANAPGLIYQFTRRPDGSYYVPIASEGIRDIFGCSPEDVADNFDAIARVLHPDDAERVIADIEYSADHLSYFTCEFRVLIPGRPVQWIYSKSTPEKLPDGSITWFGFNTNITNLKLIQEELKKSQDRFTQVAENAGEWIWEVDINGLYTYASPVVEKVLGYTPDEIIGKKYFYDLFYTEDKEETKKAALQLLASGQPLNKFLNRNIHKNGNIVWLSTSGSPILNDAGDIIGYRGADTDITDRKHAEEQLTISEEKYRSIFENVQDVFYQTDLHGTILEISPSIKHFSEFNRDELLGSNVADLYYNQVDRQVLLKALSEKGYLNDYELLLKTKTGDIKYASINARLIFDKDGKPHHIDGAIRDIGIRKKAEQAIRESDEKFAIAFKTSPYAITITKIEDGTFIEVNDSFYSMTGYTKDETIGNASIAMKIWVNENKRQEMVESLSKGKVLEGIEARFRKKNGEIIIGLFSAQLIKIREKTFILSSIADISERKRAEAELQASQQIIAGIINAIPVRVFWKDKNLVYMGCNAAFVKDAGFTNAEDIIGKDDYQMGWSAQAELYRNDDIQVIENGIAKFNIEEDRTTPEGNHLTLLTNKLPLRNAEGVITGVLGTYMDITERKQEESYREIRRDVLQILNDPSELRVSIEMVVAVIKLRTGFDAVGIRLERRDDYPYFAQEGFTESFLRTENTLKSNSEAVMNCIDSDGNEFLECTCGLVISGKTDPSHPCFTVGGSFWINDSTPQLILPPEEDPRFQPRNICIHQGYDSYAMIPIRNDKRIVGLLQLNNRKKDSFTLSTIQILESIATHIGTAIMRKQVEKELEKKMNDMQRFHELTVGREIKMIELKKEINTLLNELGQDNKYDIVG